VVAAVLLVVGAGVGLAAYRALSGGGTQPEKYAPASSFVFAKLDLDPAASQKLAIRRFAERFPSSPTHKGSGDLRDQFLRSAFGDSRDIDYDRDVKPWLGDRAGVAGFLDTEGKPQAEVILQYTDRDKARRGLDKMASGSRYSLQDGYAVLAETQAAVDQAVRQAATSNLGADARYRKDVDGLTGSQVITAWVDIERSVSAGQRNAAGRSKLPPGLAEAAKGRLALGVHAGEDYVEVEGATYDTSTPASSGSATDMLKKLPEGTLAAVSIGDAGKAITSGFDRLRATPGFDRIQPTLDSIQQQTGLRLPGDLATLLGRSAVFSLGSLPRAGAEPLVGVRSRPTDVGAGRKIAEQIAALARSSGGVTVETRQAGDDVILAVGPGYAGRLAEDGRLGDAKLFRSAMGDLPAKVGFAAYADLGSLVRDVRRDSADFSHLAGFGVSTWQDGKSQRLRIRLVAR
jgi:hypothetical protein